MKAKPILATAAMAITAGGLIAQAQRPALYNVTDTGTLGGAYSYTYTLSPAGVVGGGAATAEQTDGLSQTAFIWDRGQTLNLGTAGGDACADCSSASAGVSGSGRAAIVSEAAAMDPIGEDFCGFGTHHQCVAALWTNGTLTVLPGLRGGNNTQAYWTADTGEIAGFSEIGTLDSSCIVPYQRLRFEGVRWGIDGAAHRLRPLPGDTVSFAIGVNDRGQAVGVSGLCSNTSIPPNTPGGPHAVLWEQDGTPVALPALSGAVGNNVAGNINNRGDVAGTQVLSDDTVHTFLWNRDAGLQDVMMPGSFVTVAPCCHTLNDQRSITGFAIGESGPTTFVWRDGLFTDLNSVLPSGSPWYVFLTNSINNAGQIAATGVNTDTGEIHGLLLSPIATTGAPAARGDVRPPALPSGAFTMLRQAAHKRP